MRTYSRSSCWLELYLLFVFLVGKLLSILVLFHTISRVANFWSDFKIWRRISLFKISAFSRFALFARRKSRGNKNIFHVLFSMKWKTGSNFWVWFTNSCEVYVAILLKPRSLFYLQGSFWCFFLLLFRTLQLFLDLILIIALDEKMNSQSRTEE